MPTFVKVTRYNSSVGSFEYSKFSTAPFAIFLYKILFSSKAVTAALSANIKSVLLPASAKISFWLSERICCKG